MSLLTRPRTLSSGWLFERLSRELASGEQVASVGRLLVVIAQLGLVLLVVHAFRIEELFGFLLLTPLVFFGFILHALLPLRFRLPFFVLLSLAAIWTVLGYPHSVGLVVIGLGLIGICHLPVPLAVRVVLLLGAGGVLAAVRAGWVETSWVSLPTVVLPVLGAMFMFRLIIYLYDLRHERTPASIWERLAYFFMLPNICFLLFPVVDYQTFRRTYYDAESAAIYQKGVLWMFRGVVHLLLYRLVYYHLMPAPSDIVGLGTVVQSVLATFLLYLRISGQFHLIIGLMCLFGFNLPETHHLYFLASSFNDFWRRINIYWKDFMMKIFYFPSLMRLRRWGMTTALVGATATVFFGTWILHSYQWFWLRGTFPIRAVDVLFWGLLGGLVVVNSLYEARRGRKRSLSKKKEKGWGFRSALALSAQTVAFFAFIAVLWSLWSSPSVAAWAALMAKAGHNGLADFGALLLGLAVLVLVGVGIQYLSSRGWHFTLVGSQPSFARAAWTTSLGAGLLLALGQPGVQSYLSPGLSTLVASLQEEHLNRQDEVRMERGYYEGLLHAESYTSALWHLQVHRPEDWEGIGGSDEIRFVDNLLVYELIPSYDGTFRRASFHTNRWGMRDRAYTKEKPLGTFRIALLGSSYSMGSGVEAEQSFGALVEGWLNHRHTSGPYDHYEILNFSVGGYSVLQNVKVAHDKIFAFNPDAVFIINHSSEYGHLSTHLRHLIKLEKDISDEYAHVRRLLKRTGLTAEASRMAIREEVQPYLDQLIWWSFREIGAVCREHGITPVWIYVPTTVEVNGIHKTEFAHLARFAREAGFITLSLEGAYEGYDDEAVQVAVWDTHPNPLGHRLLAERLYEVLLQNSNRLQLGLSETPGLPVSH